eukprot:PhF_6_TR18680/c0_g1_i2/m.27307
MILMMWGGVGVSHVAPFLDGVWHRISSYVVPMSPFVILPFLFYLWKTGLKAFLTVASCILARDLVISNSQSTQTFISNIVYFALTTLGCFIGLDAVRLRVDSTPSNRSYGLFTILISAVMLFSGPLSLRTPRATLLQTVLVPSLVDMFYDVEDEISLRVDVSLKLSRTNVIKDVMLIPRISLTKICVKSLIWNGVMGMGVLCG